MRIKLGYSMGYVGTDSEWQEDIPEDVVAEGQNAIDAYIEQLQGEIWQEASEKISAWVEIIE
jgi:hypothetical protein